MAIIKCPECRKYTSARVRSCPYCGQLVSGNDIISADPEPQPTRIGPLEKNRLRGFFGLLAGFCIATMGFAMLYVFIPVGIAMFLGGGVLLLKANSVALGSHRATCPHCGKPGTVSTTARDYKCPSCEKISIKDGEYLRPV